MLQYDQSGNVLGWAYLWMIEFADEQVIIAEDKNNVEFMTSKLKEAYKYWELEINLEKPNTIILQTKWANWILRV